MPIALQFSTALVLVLICLTAPACADRLAGLEVYEHGDYATALQELRPLAEQGDPSSQFYLGMMYETGSGVSKDYTQAFQWYEKAAAQGLAEAQFQLGMLYAVGDGVPQDIVQAYKWYDLAEANGKIGAASFRDAFSKKMTPAQITEAQKLAREWKPQKK